jgi:AraC family transcriptional regulator of adaptative response/methylated-DNA-[protein]-cysteine methyltransferase
MRIGTYDSSFGKVAIATQDGKLVGVTFGSPEILTEYLRGYDNYIIDNEPPSASAADKILESINYGTNYSLNHYLFGTPFQVDVWRELQRIPSGTVRSYQEIANAIGKPKSVRAVANAVGANPIAVLVPCHRVVRSDGSLGGYRWGKELKKKLLKREGITSYI